VAGRNTPDNKEEEEDREDIDNGKSTTDWKKTTL
jgi:hypothetical protein